MAGCGVQKGAVIGKTNANGTQVTDREVNGGHLFHTYLEALGLDPAKNFYPNGRPVPVGHGGPQSADRIAPSPQPSNPSKSPWLRQFSRMSAYSVGVPKKKLPCRVIALAWPSRL